MDENNTPRNLSFSSSAELAGEIVHELSLKKAGGLKLIHVENQTIIADYFVICTGTSNTQIRALANNLEFKLGEAGVYPSHIEGLDDATWVLLDYGAVIVHIFNGETRRFYNLEKLWVDGDEIDIEKYLTE